jgi:cysteine synthase A
VDGFIGENTLYILNTTAIRPEDILLARKRMATPITTPYAEFLLHKFSEQTSPEMIASNFPAPDTKKLDELLVHLQTLSGYDDGNKEPYPVIFTAGLVSTASLYFTLSLKGGADIVMCSTAYGGSSQLLDIFTKKTQLFKKHTFNIQGDVDMVQSVRSTLSELSASKNLLPITVLFIEIPTNPDMKVPELSSIISLVREYIKNTQKEFLLVVDTTFAPNSKVLEKIQKIDPSINAMVFISLSKSISGGFTTCGTLVSNQTSYSKQLLREIKDTATVVDANAKNEQLQVLIDHHIGVEERIQYAYQNAVAVANALVKAVHQYTSTDMQVKFVTPEQAAMAFTSPTFSFNLPSLKGGSAQENESLAQRFVDILCSNAQYFKPCVSFGQDNTLVYATVPATSTQGAIKPEDKEKQAVGGVQLVRLSFPPRCDLSAVCQIITNTISKIYSN